jgi:carbamoyl-phosphate synthase large subunit
VRTILINSNPATIMTDPSVADVIYLEPLTVEAVEAVIAREQPEGLLAGLGGQTALNLATAMAEAGVFDRHRSGSSARPSRRSGWPRTARRSATCSIESTSRMPRARSSKAPRPRRARRLPTPHSRRSGCRRSSGRPSPLAARARDRRDRAGYRERIRAGLRASPIGQVMVERCLVGWQEIEYEVMRDADDTCIAVCSMENVDPLGVHTGDSIVVAPVQTLTDAVHQRPAQRGTAIIRALGVEGGCNVQFALSPDSTEYAVIEVNRACRARRRWHRRRPATRSPGSRRRSRSAAGSPRSRTS